MLSYLGWYTVMMVPGEILISQSAQRIPGLSIKDHRWAMAVGPLRFPYLFPHTTPPSSDCPLPIHHGTLAMTGSD